MFFFKLKNKLKWTNSKSFMNVSILKKSAQEQEPFYLKTLEHIIGMKEPPFYQKISEKKTRTLKERFNDFLSLEKNRERNKELLKDISKSYWSNIQAMKYHQGKTWIAPKDLFKKDKALYVADFHGTTLSNKISNVASLIESSPVSLLSVFSSKSGEKHVKSFLSNKLQLIPNIQYIYVNFQEGFLKAALVRMFSATIRSQVLKEHYDKYFFVNKLPKNIKENMMISNICVGYIYLVDNQCRIRWAGCGNATEEEKEYLITCSQRLIEEYKTEH
ncbi:hypothetical protein PORY_002257 [Pneumocystis oryctolagi]|uniref:Uncharacterized protein n=1 Tax=Pneumocystis oryctolagi TaxID=42067 RepID=A0ACB7CB42_9ASCO|nr:hypothetical protein PORY_002257 [Pneumocystis oryctolagi]